MTKILMVCLGNICRSPLAEGILREKIKKRDINAVVDSAGTATYHIGENPDPRAVITAQKHNIDISHLVARQFTTEDFDEYDSIYVMDTANFADVLSLARNEDDRKKVELLLNVIEPNLPPGRRGSNRSVPDPWHGGGDSFEDVFQLLDEACGKIVDLLK